MFTKQPRSTISGFSRQRHRFSLLPNLLSFMTSSAYVLKELRCHTNHANWEISDPARGPLFCQEVIHLRPNALLQQAECDTAYFLPHTVIGSLTIIVGTNGDQVTMSACSSHFPSHTRPEGL